MEGSGRHSESEEGGKEGSMGELDRREFMINYLNQELTPNEVGKSNDVILRLLEALYNVSATRCIPRRGETQEETPFVPHGGVISVGGGIVEHANPPRRRLFRRGEGRTPTQLTETCVASESRCHSWEGPTGLFRHIGMGRILNVPIEDTRNNSS